MKKFLSFTLITGMLVLSRGAMAEPEVELIWTGTSGSGTPGSSTITAEQGDVLQLDILVNGDPRVSIAKERNDGTDWGKNTGWHHVRIKRDIESGEILVFFDDMEDPIMKAEDKTFTSGPIGFGSFDDVGHFDNIKIYAPKK